MHVHTAKSELYLLMQTEQILRVLLLHIKVELVFFSKKFARTISLDLVLTCVLGQNYIYQKEEIVI